MIYDHIQLSLSIQISNDFNDVGDDDNILKIDDPNISDEYYSPFNLIEGITADTGEIAGYTITDSKLEKITDLGSNAFTSMSFRNLSTGGRFD